MSSVSLGRETENNAYAKFLGDKQRALWYVMVFSGVVNSTLPCLPSATVFLSDARSKQRLSVYVTLGQRSSLIPPPRSNAQPKEKFQDNI